MDIPCPIYAGLETMYWEFQINAFTLKFELILNYTLNLAEVVDQLCTMEEKKTVPLQAPSLPGLFHSYGGGLQMPSRTPQRKARITVG